MLVLGQPPSGVPILVSDVARVEISSLTRYGAVSRNGVGEVVEGLVLSLRGANAGQTVANVQAKLDELSVSLPEGVHLEVFYDRGRLVSAALSSVNQALLEAIAFVYPL